MQIKKDTSNTFVFLQLLRGSISNIFGFLFTLYGLFAGIRDDFIPQNIAEKLRLGGVFSTIAWYWYFIIGLFLLWIGTAYEATKRLSKKDNENNPSNTATANDGSQAASISGNNNTLIQNAAGERKEPPNIIIGFSDENRFSSQILRFNLKPLPTKPNIEELIAQKRDKLLSRSRGYSKGTQSSNPTFTGFEIPSVSFDDIFKSSYDSYPQRIEKYLSSKYKNYLDELYNNSILDDRYRELKLVVEVRGEYPISSLSIDFIMPENMLFPTKLINEIRRKREFLSQVNNHKYEVREPKEPDLFDTSSLRDTSIYAPPPAGREIHNSGNNNLKITPRYGKRTIEFHLDNLIQNRLYREFPIIPIWLDNIEKSTEWDIPVIINCNELNKPLENNLKIEMMIVEGEDEEKDNPS